MALSADCANPILLDSTYRNRRDYPFPSDFTSSIKGPFVQPTDPIGVGYVLYNDTVGAAGYTPGPAAGPGYLNLTTGIPTTFFENRLLNQFLVVIDPVTFAVKARTTVVGFSVSVPPIMNIYVSTPIVVAPADLVVVRQINSDPMFRFAGPATLIGSSTVVIPGGSSVTNAYRGKYLRNMTLVYAGLASTDYYITAYDGVTNTATITPPLTAAIAAGSSMEIYDPQDNEPGMTTPGSMFARGSMVNYEVQLEWLRIPRHPLFVNETVPPSAVASMSKTVNQFSYLLVRFNNINDGSRGVVQSNTRNASNAQFIIPVEELSDNLGRFYTLHSARAITIKFNPSEPIHFSVSLPDGTPLRFDPDDETGASLQIPNPDLQISALFTTRRKIQ